MTYLLTKIKKIFTTTIFIPLISVFLGWLGPLIFEKKLILNHLIIRIAGNNQIINNKQCDPDKFKDAQLSFLSVSTNTPDPIENESLNMIFKADSLKIFCTSTCDTFAYHLGVKPSTSEAFGENGIRINLSRLTNSKPLIFAIYANKPVLPENLVVPAMAIANCKVKIIDKISWFTGIQEKFYNLSNWNKYKFWIFFVSSILVLLSGMCIYGFIKKYLRGASSLKDQYTGEEPKPVDFNHPATIRFVKLTKRLFDRKD